MWTGVLLAGTLLGGVLLASILLGGATTAHAAGATPPDATASGLVVLAGDSGAHLVEGVSPLVCAGGLVPGAVLPWEVEVRNGGPGNAMLTVRVTGLHVTGPADAEVLEAITIGGLPLSAILAGRDEVERSSVHDGATTRVSVPVAMHPDTIAGRPADGPPVTFTYQIELAMQQLAAGPQPPTPSPSEQNPAGGGPVPGGPSVPAAGQPAAGPNQARGSMAPTGTTALTLAVIAAGAIAVGSNLVAARRRSLRRPPGRSRRGMSRL